MRDDIALVVGLVAGREDIDPQLAKVDRVIFPNAETTRSTVHVRHCEICSVLLLEFLDVGLHTKYTGLADNLAQIEHSNSHARTSSLSAVAV